MSFVVVMMLASQLTPLEHDPRFRQALVHFEQMNAAAALEDLAPLREDPRLSARDQARVEVWVGVNLCELARFDEAGVAFERALRLDPAVQLAPDISPRVATEMEAARARVGEPSEPTVSAAEPPPKTTPTPAAPTDDEPTRERSSANPPRDFPWLFTSGAALGAAGVAALGGAVGFGLASLSSRDAAVADSGARAALRHLSAAEQSAFVANTLLVGGVSLVAIGGALSLWSFGVGE